MTTMEELKKKYPDIYCLRNKDFPATKYMLKHFSEEELAYSIATWHASKGPVEAPTVNFRVQIKQIKKALNQIEKKGWLLSKSKEPIIDTIIKHMARSKKGAQFVDGIIRKKIRAGGYNADDPYFERLLYYLTERLRRETGGPKCSKIATFLSEQGITIDEDAVKIRLKRLTTEDYIKGIKQTELSGQKDDLVIELQITPTDQIVVTPTLEKLISYLKDALKET